MQDTPDTPSSQPGSTSASDPYDEIGAVYSGENIEEPVQETALEPVHQRSSGGGGNRGGSGGGGGGGRDDDDDDEDDDGDPRAKMGFFDHLEELRWTLLKCIVTFVVFFTINLFYLPEISHVLQWPLRWGLRKDGVDSLFTLKLNSPMEIFSVALQVPFILGIGMALPVIVYFLANFVAPGLKKKEKSILTPACIAIFLLFIIGACFSFFILMPTSIQVADELAGLLGFTNDWTADSYFELLTWMLLGIGLAFEFPLVIMVLIYIGLVSTEFLRQYRSYAFVFFLIFAALITPTTDPFTFLLLAGPLQALYEIAIWTGKVIERRKAQEELND